MRQGLFTINKDGSIHNAYSAHTEEIFNTGEIAGKKAITLLFEQSNLDPDTINQSAEAINSILGENAINFIFNSHILPTKFTMEKEDKHLSLTWDAITKENIVERLMVSIKDITALKKAKEDAKRKERQLIIISQIITIPERKYAQLKKSTQRFIQENIYHIENTQFKKSNIIALLFRNMHTLKGNCRTYGLDYLSEAIHNAESSYDELRKNSKAPWNQEKLLQEMKEIEKISEEYHMTYYSTLRRGKDSNIINTQTLRTLQALLGKIASDIHTITPERGKKEKYNENHLIELKIAKEIIDDTLTEPLSETLLDLTQSIPSLAEQLGKKTPKITINDNNFRINLSFSEIIKNAISHILRNSLDHGIESSKKRLELDKDVQGKIFIKCEKQTDKLIIRISDDGKGLDIKELIQKGKKMGYWKEGEKPSTQEAANFIFITGASTNETASAISGRGVGLDAARHFIEEIGGEITLTTQAQEQSIPGHIAFELLIHLPPDAYSEMKYCTIAP